MSAPTTGPTGGPTAITATSVLTGTGLHVSFGALRAVDGVDIEVRSGECVGLIGANGAGKTTLLNLLSGAVSADGGQVTVTRGEHVHRLSRAGAPQRARAGVARMFQTARLVPDLSVVENVELGLPRRGTDLLEAIGLPGAARAARRRRAAALDALARVDLVHRPGTRAGSLSVGQQRLVELARVLVSGAGILLLDEPFAGLSGTARRTVADLIGSLRRDGVGILLVEHDLTRVRELADRLVVLDAGSVLAEGPVTETLDDPAVVARYIGDLELEIDLVPDDPHALDEQFAAGPAPRPEPVGPPVLTVRDLRVFHGSVPVVHETSFTLTPGDGIGLVGPNGAGKSTALRGIAGLLRSTGEITVSGTDLAGRATPDRYAAGLAFVPQVHGGPAGLTVGDQLRLAWLSGGRRVGYRETLEQVDEVFPELLGRRRDQAASLSGGQRQMLAIGRALMASPTVVLLDEPTAGLAPALVPTVADTLTRMRDRGVAIVVVEHNLGLVRAACSHVVGLRAGRQVWSGPIADFDTATAHDIFLGTGTDQPGHDPARPAPSEEERSPR
ncbi:ATP-binding cassette domain-containing protein [Nakamurella leprariae]|uniref:Sugar ABC transporter ATP-binding protein n=1 Tax=Nakamurella leprariae TaxID=2803911 RepID=A0A938Y6I3_9ACTN|nr:ATP-binding cassette domain-containing protein [Nakamurella leprariae]MBM9466695.1 sugar ABC transporter ATP-binding protein [Nakamurella leprariae]